MDEPVSIRLYGDKIEGKNDLDNIEEKTLKIIDLVEGKKEDINI